MSSSHSLIRFLSRVAVAAGVARDTYIVGGAVRNHLMGLPAKDLDVVIDSVACGRDSADFAQAIRAAVPARTHLTVNQYGVAILTVSEPWTLDGHDMRGETIEIANARKESYGGADGKGYKPHVVAPATILEDLERREFTFNTLLFRLSDLLEGPALAPVMDLLGRGVADLAARTIVTPGKPDRTFTDDPTRMLRAVKFAVRYDFRIDTAVTESIFRNAAALRQMPWEACSNILLNDMLNGPRPIAALQMLQALGLSSVLGTMMRETPGFATAIGRGIQDADALVILEIMDRCAWPVRTPFHFLDRDDVLILREYLATVSEDAGASFMRALQRPPIDQVTIFEHFCIPPRDRGVVMGAVRRILLQEPQLASRPELLEQAVRSDLASRFTA